MIRLEPLTGRHDRNGFDCGVEALNVWLRQTALQHQARGISRTFVAVPADDRQAESWRQEAGVPITPATILGFYALASAFVLLDELPSDLARRCPRQIPVTRLGRLAVRAEMQHRGLGRLLLADAVNRARGAAQAVGSAGVVVDAQNDAAARFYQGFGFRPCEDLPLKLFLRLW
jgi:ribosomal protein S18 acetylase RimI-like enzyme